MEQGASETILETFDFTKSLKYPSDMSESDRPTSRIREEWEALVKSGQISDQDLFDLATSLVPGKGKTRISSGLNEVWFNDGLRPELPLQVVIARVDEGEIYDFKRKEGQPIKVVFNNPEGESDLTLEDRTELARSLMGFLKV